ncbi:hypothetical protein ABIE51_001408 [Lysobacter sp. OAE881]|uniref:hypothetical protein n=1 Tax=Lysobacter sp. OAE881 TaxID=2663813 RepID=UPI00178949C4
MNERETEELIETFMTELSHEIDKAYRDKNAWAMTQADVLNVVSNCIMAVVMRNDQMRREAYGDTADEQ